VTGAEHRAPVLHARQELTEADRQHAQNYTEGDVIRFSKGSKPLGIEPGEYARVARVDEETNRVTITRKLHLANRELGTIQKIDGDGNLKLKMDSGREVEFKVREMPHLDYGYAVTSHSSQGQTADRVLVHVDSEQSHGELLNSRLAYVSVSRAQFDVQMYTNDAKTLGQVLSRDVSHPSATQQQMAINNV
jgi:ATP-dependent exoDNAse (exonuclease V) alpha subunit